MYIFLESSIVRYPRLRTIIAVSSLLTRPRISLWLILSCLRLLSLFHLNFFSLELILYFISFSRWLYLFVRSFIRFFFIYSCCISPLFLLLVISFHAASERLPGTRVYEDDDYFGEVTLTR